MSQIRKDAVTGARLGRTPSWQSFGSGEEGADGEEQEQVGHLLCTEGNESEF